MTLEFSPKEHERKKGCAKEWAEELLACAAAIIRNLCFWDCLIWYFSLTNKKKSGTLRF